MDGFNGVPLPVTPTDQPTAVDWLAEAQRIAQLWEPPHPQAPGPGAATDIQRVNKFLRLVATGNYVSTAALAAGFSRQQLKNWRTQAENGNLAAIALLDALEKAEADAEESIVSDVRKAAQKEQFWAAGMTLLERRHPEKWGRRQDSESGPKVVVQIGASTADVRVNVMASYQTQSLIEGQQTQALAAADLPLIEAKVEGESR